MLPRFTTSTVPCEPTRTEWRRAPAALGLTVAALLFPIYLTTIAPGLTWANDSADGGDLIAAAASLGVAHPTGYPTYVILARLAQALPVGSLAFRTNLLSAGCAAAAAALVVTLVCQVYGGRRRFGAAGGVLAGLAFGLSPMLWSQAVVTEVYALHALFVALILYTLPLGPRPYGTPRPWLQRLAGLLFGVALGNHATAALLLPPWLAAGSWRKRRFVFDTVLNRLMGLGVGLLVYAYLPLRAAAHPAVNWGNPVDLTGMWWVLSGTPYRAAAFGLPVDLVLTRIQGWAGLLVNQFGWIGLITALCGLFLGRGSTRRVLAIAGWCVAVFSVFAIGYNTADSYAYLLPAFLALAIWLGLGAATIIENLPVADSRHWLRPAAACALGLGVLSNAVFQLPRVDASQDKRAEDFGQAVLTMAPPHAVVFTHGDRDTFTLWYFHFALNSRPDVAFVVEPLLDFAWYRDNLTWTYPTLHWPEEAVPSWREAIRRANDRPQCDAQVEAGDALTCTPP